MDNFVVVGKIINTFGIKGELKINSDFEYSDRIFQKEFPIYIGELKEKELIETHRVHKGYDLLLFKGYKNINEVLKYKGKKIYIDRFDLHLSDHEYLLSDLIGFEVYDNENLLGIIVDYEFTSNYVLLKVKGDKSFYLPKVDNYIKEIDINNKKIFTNKGSELII